MTWSSTPEPIRTQRLGYVNQRWGQLHQLSEDWGDRALKYLMLTNSGGAIAVLSFLGASDGVRQMSEPKIALGFFVLGVILVGINTAIEFHHIDSLYAKWKESVKLYLNDKLDWDSLNKEDENRSGTFLMQYVIGYAAFACFISGAAIGLWKLITS